MAAQYFHIPSRYIIHQRAGDTPTCARVFDILRTVTLSYYADCCQEVCTAYMGSVLDLSLTVPSEPAEAEMATQQSTRIWENDSAAPAPQRTSQPQPATLPSIATLTNELPPGVNGQSSPTYPSSRASEQWTTPPQSTRKLYKSYSSCELEPSLSTIITPC